MKRVRDRQKRLRNAILCAAQKVIGLRSGAAIHATLTGVAENPALLTEDDEFVVWTRHYWRRPRRHVPEIGA